jgi:hypothetical protein
VTPEEYKAHQAQRRKARRAAKKARAQLIRDLIVESKDWPGFRVTWQAQGQMYDFFEESGYVYERDYWGYPVEFGGTAYFVNIRPGPLFTYAKLKWSGR